MPSKISLIKCLSAFMTALTAPGFKSLKLFKRRWVGVAGTFAVGVIFYGDPTSLGRYLGIILIIAGVATLKLAY